MLKDWDDNARRHQTAFAAIAAYVPEFRESYGQALSHLRKLQSDDAVYLAAIERLKDGVATALSRDHPDGLEATLNEYAEKYPRLGGLDRLGDDLRQYREIDNEAGARDLGPLVALLSRGKFATPPFQEKLRALVASGRLPSPEVVAQYQAVSAAWRAGDSAQAIDGLQKMAGGPWADAATRDAEHKEKVAAQFAELPKALGAKAYDERLLAFCGMLDPAEDSHFIAATAADLGKIRDQALSRAQALLKQAAERWRQYRENGAIDGTQRQEAAISNPFRTQAGLLAEAHDAARQAQSIHEQLKAELPEPWRDLPAGIAAEMSLQRNALLDLQGALEPGVLKAKLALIGGRPDDHGKSP